MATRIDIGRIPPYGFINAEYAGVAAEIPLPLAGDAEKFRLLVVELADALAEKVWPKFEAGAWSGKAATQAMALTEADLAVGQELARFLPLAISSPDVVPRASTHLDFFKEEDCFTPDPRSTNPVRPFFPWGASFPQYAASTPWLAVKLAEAFDGPGCAESGALDLGLKIILQRPRPFQMAMLLGMPAYVHQSALSSQTPSMVSGHALQSTIAGCFVARDFTAEFAADPRLRGCFAQFMVDVGDRRVFAGVHYPSDSMASWYCALKFAGRFYGSPIRNFLWEAIQTKSQVYADVARHAQIPGSPYGAMLAWLADTAATA